MLLCLLPRSPIRLAQRFLRHTQALDHKNLHHPLQWAAAMRGAMHVTCASRPQQGPPRAARRTKKPRDGPQSPKQRTSQPTTQQEGQRKNAPVYNHEELLQAAARASPTDGTTTAQASTAPPGGSSEGSPASAPPPLSRKPEVLAPAGGWPQLRAAVENGESRRGVAVPASRGAQPSRDCAQRGATRGRLQSAVARTSLSPTPPVSPSELPPHTRPAGADAVYFGLSDFNARARASNFEPNELPDIMAYLHDRGTKGYVVLNVLGALGTLGGA